MCIYDNTNIYYVYQYLREDNTPYYIGKGKNNRAWSTQHKHKPKDESRIQIIQENMSEDDAHNLEIELIAKYGRKDIGTGILRNMTDGGEGTSNRPVKESTREKLRGENNGMYGKHHTEEAKAKIAAGAKRFNETYWTEEQRRKHGELRKGFKHSEETKKKLSLARQGKSSWNKGIVMSDEIRKNMSKSALTRPKHTCPHCNKEVTPQNLSRWHGDNCKQKRES